ncbi:MAG TPA: carbohydrate ABC transporter permease [Aggregatilinea sp.]|jgi:raffinose/stachyose/melibiose transport system permease protein|uniref:carbohydrate ABC transporter permease n=1 Tax=Aggregatilinea sp. TaxID=2806333 RepID=UPI002C157AA1|nr:carbohydrate ABC transporter permease [Aggregatilinea sp.]HML20667.1 carbohydrate ABC transporter permease [Aggregatilinea sp.]
MTSISSDLPRTAVRRPSQFPLGKILALVFLLALMVVMLFPFAIVIINAFKTPVEYANSGPLSLPGGLYTQGIVDFWNRVDFTNKLYNSTVIAVSVAVMGIVLSLLNAFALGVGRVRGRVAFLVFFLMANTLPQEALAYPLYYFAKYFGIYNNRISVILVMTVIQSAFGTYLLTSVLTTFPREILEAALIDGCNKVQLLFRIVAPISMPTLQVLFVFFFIWTWNEFFLPMILLVSTSNQTVPLAIAVLQGQFNMDATTSSASALLGLLPCIVFFLLFQRTLTRGVTAGSIK